MWRWVADTESVPVVKVSPTGGRFVSQEHRNVKLHGYCGLAPLHASDA
jgi:hypothetical protein